jgi:seryl-tRNA synthetase
MFDLKSIRKDPDSFDASWVRRGLEPQSSLLLKLDEQRRIVQTKLQEIQQERNEKSRQIGQLKREGKDADSLMAEVGELKLQMGDLEDRERTLADQLFQNLASLPNMLSDDVPAGNDEEDNKEVRKWGEPKTEKVPEHFDIGEGLGMMDFETAAKMSGSRFVLLSHGLARLERALAQFFLDTHTQEHGYTEVSPPILVKDHALYGTGQLPKFQEEQFVAASMGEREKLLRDATESMDEEYTRRAKEDEALKPSEVMWDSIYNAPAREDFWLIPTAEVPVTNIVADTIIDEDNLPCRYTAFTPCFRSEAGAAGKDTRGMIRQHQFYKVEMVSITKPDESQEELERMTGCAEAILQKLELPYRTVVLCSGDTGFGSQKTYDLEVWLPGQQRYREISSCSVYGDFQARRMKARFRCKDTKENQFVHTLNGSGVAVGRALIAVIENYYDPADGGVFVPEVLRQYMGGLDKIMPLDNSGNNKVPKEATA